MNVFNEGDRVKVVSCEIHKDCEHIGKIYTVKKISDVKYNAYKLKDCDELFKGNELELVDKLDLEGARNIKLEVGDRVTFKNGLSMLITTLSTQKIEAFKENEILKIERPKYEVIEDNNINNSNILTDKEKEYLSNVVKPFRDNIKCIFKELYDFHDEEYIVIDYIDTGDDDSLIFPAFKQNTMYKGMEIGKKYSLKELGL